MLIRINLFHLQSKKEKKIINLKLFNKLNSLDWKGCWNLRLRLRELSFKKFKVSLCALLATHARAQFCEICLMSEIIGHRLAVEKARKMKKFFFLLLIKHFVIYLHFDAFGLKNFHLGSWKELLWQKWQFIYRWRGRWGSF